MWDNVTACGISVEEILRHSPFRQRCEQSGAQRLFFEIFNRAVVLFVALCMIYFGYLNFLDGFKSLRMPSMTPLATLYAAIPLCGALVALFTIEQMVNGWRNGFPDIPADERRTSL